MTPESATPRRSLSQRIKSMSQDVLGRNHRRGPSEAIDLRGGLVAAEISAPFQLGPTRRDLPSGDVTCGSNDYTIDQVSAAVSAGFDHVDDPIGSGTYIALQMTETDAYARSR